MKYIISIALAGLTTELHSSAQKPAVRKLSLQEALVMDDFLTTARTLNPTRSNLNILKKHPGKSDSFFWKMFDRRNR